MLGVNSSKKMVRPPCPFQETDSRCGADTVLIEDQTMVRCRRGHLTDVDQIAIPVEEIVAAEEIAVPLIHRLRFSFDAKNLLLAALAIDAVVRHL